MTVALVAVLGVSGLTIVRQWQRGTGVRTGTVVKFSYKGLIQKSWEGELMLGSTQSGKTWDFSVDPKAVEAGRLIQEIQDVQLKMIPVSLKYEQKFIWPWIAETNFLVTEVQTGKT